MDERSVAGPALIPEVVEPETAQASAQDLVRGGVQGEAQLDAQYGGSGGDGEAERRPVPQLSPEESCMSREFDMFRSRLHDISDERFEQVLRELRAGDSNSAVARRIVEEGLCADLNPATVRHYVARIRGALGLPGYAEPQEQIAKVSKEDETDEPIEGQPAMRRLRWLSRLQQARVRKALKLEAMMGGMLMPQASSEIKLLSDLIDKELEIAVKTGDVKTVPTAATLELSDSPVKTPVEAFRVLLAYRRLQKQLPKILAEQAAAQTASETHTDPDAHADGGGPEAVVGADPTPAVAGPDVGETVPAEVVAGAVEPGPGDGGSHAGHGPADDHDGA